MLTFLGRVVSLAYNLVSEAVFGFMTKKTFCQALSLGGAWFGIYAAIP